MATTYIPRVFGGTIIISVAPPTAPSPAPPLIHTRDLTSLSVLRTVTGKSTLVTRDGYALAVLRTRNVTPTTTLKTRTGQSILKTRG
jgi:hypothetical protein